MSRLSSGKYYLVPYIVNGIGNGEESKSTQSLRIMILLGRESNTGNCNPLQLGELEERVGGRSDRRRLSEAELWALPGSAGIPAIPRSIFGPT